MKIGILGSGKGWHSRCLAEACLQLGHVPDEIDLTTLVGDLSHQGAKLLASKIDLLSLDRAIVRSVPGGSLEQVIVRVDALHRLVEEGVSVLNPPRAIEACVDKYLAAARLCASGLPTPRTIVCERIEDAMNAYHALGGTILVKPIFGAEGKGIIHIDTEAHAWRVFQSLRQIGNVLLLQEFIPNDGSDVRVFVLGERVVASMRRRAAPGEYRANITVGGQAEPIQLTPEIKGIALRAARSLGAFMAGVDLLFDSQGRCLVIEVNSSPGFKALSQVTGIDVAREIISYVVDDFRLQLSEPGPIKMS